MSAQADLFTNHRVAASRLPVGGPLAEPPDRVRPAPNSPTGQQLKRAGQRQALERVSREWRETVLYCLRSWCRGRAAWAFEDFRAYWQQSGGSAPPSHKVWGCLPQIAMRAGFIEWTGQYRAATSPKTRGHPVKVYREVRE